MVEHDLHVSLAVMLCVHDDEIGMPAGELLDQAHEHVGLGQHLAHVAGRFQGQIGLGKQHLSDPVKAGDVALGAAGEGVEHGQHSPLGISGGGDILDHAQVAERGGADRRLVVVVLLVGAGVGQ